MPNIIDRCPNRRCQGRLRIVSLSVEERMRRRIGRAWLGRCPRCGAETLVNSQAWRTFMRETRESKRVAEYDRSVSAGEVFRFENPGIDDEYDADPIE
jgi:hypothetical protein